MAVNLLNLVPAEADARLRAFAAEIEALLRELKS